MLGPTPPLTPAPPALAVPLPQVWPVFAACALALVLVVTASVVTTVLCIVLGGRPDSLTTEGIMRVPGFLPVSMAGTELSLLLVAVGAPLLFRDAAGGLGERLHWRPGRVRVVDVLLLTAGVIGLGHATEALAMKLGLWTGVLASLPPVVRGMSGPGFVAVLVIGAGGAGLCEELFFRGLAQPRLVERLGPAAGVGVASLLFGLLHMDLVHTPVAFLLGLLFGWAAWRSGTIVTGVIAHLLNNASSFLLTRFELELPGTGTLAGALSGLAVTAACAIALQARWRTTGGQPKVS